MGTEVIRWMQLIERLLTSSVPNVYEDIDHNNLPTLYSFPLYVVLCLYIVSAWVDDVLSSLYLSYGNHDTYEKTMRYIQKESSLTSH
jgi:hypothetical protein